MIAQKTEICGKTFNASQVEMVDMKIKCWPYSVPIESSRSCHVLMVLFLVAAFAVPVSGKCKTALPIVDAVPRDHLEETVNRVVEALEFLRSPVTDADLTILEAAIQRPDDKAIGVIQAVLDSYCLVGVSMDEEGWLTVRPASPDPNARRLVQHQWQTFLVKVHNDSTVTTPMEVASPQALLPGEIPAEGDPLPTAELKDPDDWSRWVGVRLFQDPPMQANLSGKPLDYLVLQLYSRDVGMRAAELVFRLGGGAVRRGHFADTSLLFRIDAAKPAHQKGH